MKFKKSKQPHSTTEAKESQNLERPANETEGSGTEETVAKTNDSRAAETKDSRAADLNSTENTHDLSIDELKNQLLSKEDELEESRTKLAETQDSYLRLRAEYENFSRRTKQEKAQIYSDAVSSVTTEWLAVLDNLERASVAIEQSSCEEAKALAEGVAMIFEQAKAAMEKLGVEEIEAMNAPFDPNLHEAVMHVEDDTVGENTIVEVFQKGYKRGDRVIRHSVVRVAN